VHLKEVVFLNWLRSGDFQDILEAAQLLRYRGLYGTVGIIELLFSKAILTKTQHWPG